MQPDEWYPWRRETWDFGVLFVNVVLCLVPGLAVLAIRLIFRLARKFAKNGRFSEESELENQVAVGELRKRDTEETTGAETRDRNVLLHVEQASNFCPTTVHIVKAPWVRIRLVCGFACSAVAIVLFMAFSLAAQVERNHEDMPWGEALGFLSLFTSSIFITAFYRAFTKRPSTHKFRLLVCRICWSLVWIVSLIRAYSLLRRWNAVPTSYPLLWKILLAVAYALQFILVSANLFSFWHHGNKRESSESVIIQTFPRWSTSELIRSGQTSQEESREALAGTTSSVLFEWLTRLVLIGRKRKMTIDDVHSLKPNMRALNVYARFQFYWSQRTPGRWALTKALWSFAKPSLLQAAGFKFLYDSLIVLDPLFLNLLVIFMTGDRPESKLRGVLFVALLGLNNLTQTCLLHQYFHTQMSLGIKLRSALSTAVYEKALKVDRNALNEDMMEKVSSGKILTLLSVDTQRLGDLMSYVHILWSAPYQVTIICVLLYKQLGVASLAGIGLLILSIPFTGEITRQVRKMQKKVMKQKDDRTRVTNETLNGIRAVKVYVWEEAKMNQIVQIRHRELRHLWHSQLVLLINRVQTYALPVLVAVVSFTVFAKAQGKVLTPAITFTSLALFNILRFPLIVLPNVIMSVAEATVTTGRIQEFLLLPEAQERVCSKRSNTETSAISIVNLTINYGTKKNVLSGFGLRVSPGDFVCVIGRTGSGKTSLIGALLCDIEVETGSTSIIGSVAYCAQTAWILSGTVRSNILFGFPFDAERYSATVAACALLDDLAIFPNGDSTEIGERGVNLSGGQKQRIALARAVYRQADVYILDDVLSAVDSHVADHITQQVFCGLLKGKTIWLVTHRLECLPNASQIVFIKEEGQVSVFPSLHEAKYDKDFVVFSQEECTKQQSEEVEAAGSATPTDGPDGFGESPSTILDSAISREGTELIEASVGRKGSREASVSRQGSVVDDNKRLIEDENMAEGAVAWSVYAAYFKAGGLVVLCGILFFMVSGQVMSVMSGFWLSKWTESSGSSISATRGLLVYSMYQLANILATCLGTFLLAVFAQAAARFFHARMLERVVRATLGFFEATPVGRLTNRFSKDLYVVDESIPQTFYSFIQNVIVVGSVIVVICIVLPVLIALVVPIAIVYWFIEKLYVAVARQIKRIDSVTRSPVFSHFTETLEGIRTIRAFDEMQRFQQLNLHFLDQNLSVAYLYVASNRWLAVRLESLGSVLVFGVALGCVLSRDKLPAALCGLAISYAISVTNSLNWLVRMSGDRESNIVSVERITELNEEAACPQEKYQSDPEVVTEPPHPGQVEFKNVFLRYRPGMNYALKGVSFVIHPGEKVGVVGRTGAGKSSLLQCLLKTLDVSKGVVLLEGRAVSTLAVTSVRSAVSVIPQDPFLFSGSVRSNLDPLNLHSDLNIWNALDRACLKSVVEEFPTKLDHPVTEVGANFSAGQRQLLCLARVLLRDAKILLLDEATSAVDPVTDALIQNTIRTEFKNCTVLTIAHRLKTVLDYDRVIVMAGGRVAEIDEPGKLASNPNSLFASMLRVNN